MKYFGYLFLKNVHLLNDKVGTMKSEKFVRVPIKCVSRSDTLGGPFVVYRLSADNLQQKVKVPVSRSSVCPVQTHKVARSLYPDCRSTICSKKLKFQCPDQVCVPFGYRSLYPDLCSVFFTFFWVLQSWVDQDVSH